ncbi:MAG: AI-2E family transporter [Anaerolineales bacterium]|nr:AI-2E family transporter [Anaerolineales bacterium]
MVRFQYVLPLLLAAIILSTAVRPGVSWLEKHGIARPIGVVMIFGTVGILLGLLIWTSIPVLGKQLTAMSQSLNEGYKLLLDRLHWVPNILIQRFLIVLPDDLSQLLPNGSAAITESDLPSAATQSQGEYLLITAVQFITILMLTFYWTLEGNFLKQSLFLLIPLEKRDNTRDLIAQIENKVRDYLLGQGVLCLAIGSLAFVAYLLIGLPNALLLAVFAGLLEAVPIVGPFLGAIPAMIIGLSISPASALWVLVATAIIQQLENSFLVPRVMKRAIGIRPLVTLLALLAFSAWFGVLGALIALPLAAVLQLLLDRYLLDQENLQVQPIGRDQYSSLLYETNQLVQDVRHHIRYKEGIPTAATDAIEDELEEIALDLENYLARQSRAKP